LKGWPFKEMEVDPPPAHAGVPLAIRTDFDDPADPRSASAE
jgi:hypothetical protein